MLIRVISMTYHIAISMSCHLLYLSPSDYNKIYVGWWWLVWTIVNHMYNVLVKHPLVQHLECQKEISHGIQHGLNQENTTLGQVYLPITMGWKIIKHSSKQSTRINFASIVANIDSQVGVFMIGVYLFFGSTLGSKIKETPNPYDRIGWEENIQPK